MHSTPKKKVIICGYPKSGTTWTTRLVAQLLNCPSLGFFGFDGDTIDTEGTERVSDYVCYKSHHTYSDLMNDKVDHIKLIYIVRDPRDIVVSGAYHFLFYTSWFYWIINIFKLPKNIEGNLKALISTFHTKRYKIKRMISMLLHGDSNFTHCTMPWDIHVSTFLDKEDVLIIKYEDLLLNGLNTSRKILEYCEVVKTNDLIEIDLKDQSFIVKKSKFKSLDDKLKVKHMRKGIIGDWKNQLSKSNALKIEKSFGKLMQRLGYEFI